MKSPILNQLALLLFCSSMFSPVLAVDNAPNGIKLPSEYKDWRVISQSHRIDNNTLRTILGNDIAIEAARSNNTNPWPKGSILAKLVWKQAPEQHWPSAIAPEKFVHAEFMIKNDNKYNSTGGWGYARWLGLDQKPYGTDKDFAQECVACHTPVKDNDYVFTKPAEMP